MAANIFSLMNANELNSLIPERLKVACWNRTKIDGKTVYTAQTWARMVADDYYKSIYGETILYKNAIWQGQNIGDRYLVVGEMLLSRKKDNALGLADANLEILLNIQFKQEFINENI